MNFLIFRDFSRFFLNFSEFKIDLFELNLLKFIYFIAYLCGIWYGASSKSGTTWGHMRPSRFTHLYLCPRVWVRARACAHVCARVCICLRRKHLVKDFCYLFNRAFLIYTWFLFYFLTCGTLFRVINAQVTWHYEERSIRAFHEDCQSSLESGGTWVITCIFHLNSYII